MNGSYIPFVYRWAVTQATPLGKMPLAVLTTLITYMDMKSKTCWPSRRLIAAQIYGTEPEKVEQWQMRKVGAAINILVANELILKDVDVRWNGSISSNNYEILVPNFEDVETYPETGTVPTPEQGRSPTPNQGVPPTPERGPSLPQNGGVLKSPVKAPVGSVQEEGSTEGTSPEGVGSREEREEVWQRVADKYHSTESKKDPVDRMSIPDYITMAIEKGY